MASRSRTLSVEFVGDTRDLERAFKRVDRSTGQAESRLSKFGAAAGTAFRVGGAAAASAAVGTGALGAKLVDLASDAEETASKFKNVFGNAATDATKQLDAFSKATGTSKFALREQAAQLQALIRPMGLNTKNASEMSVGLTKLATDLASFNNSSVDEAITALQSGLVGEAEPLRRFGVQLSAARVEAYAYANGIAKAGSDLTAAQKAQASYAIILEDTQLAQGDATETAGSFANQYKRLKANLSDLGTEIGMKLLPFVTRLAESLNTLFKGGDGAGRFAQKFGEIGSAVQKFATSSDLRNFGRDVATIFRGLDKAVGGFGNVARSTFAGIRQQFAGLAQFIRGFARTIAAIFRGDFRAAFGGLKDVASGALRVMVGTIRTFTAPIRNAFKSLFGGFGGIVKSAFNGVVSGIKSALSAVFNLFRSAIQKINDATDIGIPGLGKVGAPNIPVPDNPFDGGGGRNRSVFDIATGRTASSGKPAASGKPTASSASLFDVGTRRVSRGGNNRATRQAPRRGRGTGGLPTSRGGGGIIALGKALQRMGYQVGEHPAFGGVAPVHKHYPPHDHYSGGALDINGGPGGEPGSLDRLAAMLRAGGWNVLWRVSGHFDHLHVDTSNGVGRLPGGGSAGDVLAGGGGGTIGGFTGGGGGGTGPDYSGPMSANRESLSAARGRSRSQVARARQLYRDRQPLTVGSAPWLEQETAQADILNAGGNTQAGLARKRSALIARLAKINAALKNKKLRQSTRTRLLQEKGQILGDLRQNSSDFGELNAPAGTGDAVDAADTTGSGDPNQALIDSNKELAQKMEDLAAIEAEIRDNQRQLLIVAQSQPQVLIGALIDAVNGGIGGRAGLGFQSPSWASGAARY